MCARIWTCSAISCKGEIEKADANRKFYDEYFSVADLPAEFYLDTVRKVFQEYHLARGIFNYRNRKVDPRAVRKTSLLTVEGERDDICGLGQTMAAQDLLSSRQAVPQEALCPGGRRPLWRVLRHQVAEPNLPDGSQHDPGIGIVISGSC